MKKLFKIIVAIGGAIAGILAIFAASKSSQSKKEFNKRVKANEDKLDFITKKADKVKKDKAVTKSKIKKTSAKIKATKSKVKSTRSAKKTVDSFEKKYRKK
jgi:septal ring factor EnvC (AmiA/AmiB activator)